MEYIEGETLRQKIKARALQLKDTLDIAIQIAEGLGKAHETGIVHRDLKPENLMIRRDGYAKILDFGLAKLVAQREKALAAADSAQKTLLRVETESGTLLGTVNYMAPEQLLASASIADATSSPGWCLRDADRHLPVRQRNHRHDACNPARAAKVSGFGQV